VDKEGNVVGVSVAIIVGSRINFAVPGDYVHVIFNGRLSAMDMGQTIESGHDVAVHVHMELINPLDRIKHVEVDVWMGDAKARVLPPSEKEPESRPGETPRKRYTLSVHHDSVKGEVTLPQWPLPTGKACWVQPLITYQNGTRWWLTPTSYFGDMPVKPRPIKLFYRNAQGTRRVVLKITDKFAVVSRRGQENVLNSVMTAALSEQTGPVDKTGKAAVIYKIEDLQIEDKFEDKKGDKPENNKPGEKKPEDEEKEDEDKPDEGDENDDPVKRFAEQRKREQQRMIDNCGFIEFRMEMDGSGTISKGATYKWVATPPEDVQSDLRSLAGQLLAALQCVAVTLPNRDPVTQNEHWEGKRPMVFRSIGGGIRSELNLKYTYLGMRMRDNRREALIETTGVARGGVQGFRMGGRVEGRALVDMDTGAIFLARTRVTTDFNIHLRRGDLNLRGTTEIELDRRRS
jgi:hypothetical protein